jgi:benzoyl-CoA reductase subunit C
MMFTDFEKIVANRNEYARALKERKGTGVIGYLCSYVPEEIIYAAGFIPIRLFSTEDLPTSADSLMQTYYCTFARSILHQGLTGQLDFLDGLVAGYSCTTMRLSFDNIQLHADIPFSRFVYVPALIDTPDAHEYFYKELVGFKRDMEDLSGHAITDDDIREAIRIYDENRSLTLNIFEGRKESPPRLTGKESYLITLSGMLTDKQEHSAMLKKLIEVVPQRSDLKEEVNRIMIVGSPLDNIKLLNLIEDDLGAAVVTDDTCTGMRYVSGLTPDEYIDGDPLKAMVKRYLISRPPCPSKHSPSRWLQCTSCPFRDTDSFSMKPDPKKRLPESHPFSVPERICRFRHSLQLAINHRVEGVIALLQKFCDPHGFDYHHVVQAFEDIGVPTLFLEIDNVISVGQIKTRVQAFLEMLQPVDYIIEPEIREGIKL